MDSDVAGGQPSGSEIVVGIDGSEAALGAARWAADFAAKSAAPLVLLHAAPRLDWHFTTDAPEISPGGADAVLAAAEAAVRSAHPDLGVQTTIVKQSVTAALQDASDG